MRPLPMAVTAGARPADAAGSQIENNDVAAISDGMIRWRRTPTIPRGSAASGRRSLCDTESPKCQSAVRPCMREPSRTSHAHLTFGGYPLSVGIRGAEAQGEGEDRATPVRIHRVGAR